MTARRSRPLAAVVAVVLGITLLAGTAYAAPLTAAKVRKIAAKVVKKQAPQLTVKSAKTADTAATATTATTATTAGDAAKLGGEPPAAFRESSSVANSNVPIASLSTSGTTIAGPEGISATSATNYLHVTGVASFSGGNTTVELWYDVDGACAASGVAYALKQVGHTANPTSLSVTQLVSVDPGEHLLRLCAKAGAANVSVGARTIVADTIAVAGD